MEVIISFFLGSMVLFQILIGVAVIGLIFSTISPNMRAHISHFFGNKAEENITPPPPPNPPIDVTPVTKPEQPHPLIEENKQPAIHITLKSEVPKEHVYVSKAITPQQPFIQPSNSKSVNTEETPLGEVFPDINIGKILKDVIEEKIKEKAFEISGLDQDDFDGLDYMEDNDPRKIQYEFALIAATQRIKDPNIPVIFLCPSCHKNRLRLIKGRTCYFWSCDNCKATYDNSKHGIPIVVNSLPVNCEPVIYKSNYSEYNIYESALQISKLTQEDIIHMSSNNARICKYKMAIRMVYGHITGDIHAIPIEGLPPYQIFVLVAIYDDNSGVYSKKLYSYFLGNKDNVHEGDDVIVYVKKGKYRRIAKVLYISNPFVPPLNVTKSPINIKVKGRFLASSSGRRFHNPCCRKMDKTTETDAIWFQTRGEAINSGFVPCKVCRP